MAPEDLASPGSIPGKAGKECQSNKWGRGQADGGGGVFHPQGQVWEAETRREEQTSVSLSRSAWGLSDLGACALSPLTFVFDPDSAETDLEGAARNESTPAHGRTDRRPCRHN